MSAISALLSSKPDQVADAVQRLMGENNKIRQELFRTRDALIAAQIEGAPSGRESMLFFYDDMDAASMRRASMKALKNLKATLVHFPEMKMTDIDILWEAVTVMYRPWLLCFANSWAAKAVEAVK